MRVITKTVVQQPKRPSGYVHSRGRAGLDTSAYFHIKPLTLESYKLPLGSRMYRLVDLALKLFKKAETVGLEALLMAKKIELELEKSLGCHRHDEPGLDQNKVEHADYQHLAIFIFEKQIGRTIDGLYDPSKGGVLEDGRGP